LKVAALLPLFLVAVGVMAGRLYHLQIQNHAFFTGLANRQTETVVRLPARRGTIYDTNSVELAISLDTPCIFADPGILALPVRARRWLPDVLGVPHPAFRTFLREDHKAREAIADPTRKRLEEVTRRLAKHLHAREDVLLRRLDGAMDERIADAARRAAPVLAMSEGRLRRAFARPRRFVRLVRTADDETADAIRRLDIRGLCVRSEPQRRMVDGLSISQWLGFCTPEDVGLEGLEKIFERRLRGTPGIARLERDGRGQRIADSAEPDVPPKHGCDVYLTIDLRIQKVVDDVLQKLHAELSPVSATALVMDPWTGRILAMDSVPGLEYSQLGSMTSAEARLRLRNHAVQSVYEPGSTFKPFVVATALELGLVTPDSQIDCENGVWRYRSRTLHDSHPLGVLTVRGVVVHSSNIGAAKIGLELGPDRMQRMLRSLHFGRSYGLHLLAEESGIVTPASRWTYWSTTSVPMGQEIACTPIQLLNALCAVVNGGRLMRPFVVEQIRDPNLPNSDPRDPRKGRVVNEQVPTVIRRVFSRPTSRVMRSMLAGVVQEGTGKRLRDTKYPIGGKTGTASKRDPDGPGYAADKYVASFIGFAPVESPQIAVLVLVDEPPKGCHYGGKAAAPAVGRIVDRTLSILESAPAGPQAGVADRVATR
jgi:cell division protein FtsI (penicillin-binding protein 3)